MTTVPQLPVLFPSEPLIVNPELAKLVGLNESIVLQQMLYWIRKESAQIRDGERWVYNTYADWRQQFVFWSTDTIRGIIRKLESPEFAQRVLGLAEPPANGFLVSTDRYNAVPTDRRKWYRLDFGLLRGLAKSPDEAASAHRSRCEDSPPLEVGEFAASNTETTQRLQTESLPLPPMTEDDEFEAWWGGYPNKQKKPRARKAWEVARKKNLPALPQVLQALAQHKRSDQWTRDGGRYVPHPATWLNEEMWADRLPESGDSAGNVRWQPDFAGIDVEAEMRRMLGNPL